MHSFDHWIGKRAIKMQLNEDRLIITLEQKKLGGGCR